MHGNDEELIKEKSISMVGNVKEKQNDMDRDFQPPMEFYMGNMLLGFQNLQEGIINCTHFYEEWQKSTP